MNNINQIIGGLFPPHQPKEDEYINEADGLIYCAKCRTPRQCVIHHGERIITPLVMCDCQRITEEREEAAFQKRQAEFRIERMKASGLQDRYLHQSRNQQSPRICRSVERDEKELYRTAFVG